MCNQECEQGLVCNVAKEECILYQMEKEGGYYD